MSQMIQAEKTLPKPVTMTLQEVREEASGVKSFLFKYDKDHFKYRSDQVVILFPDGANPALRHAFSIASSPTEDFLMLSTRMRAESAYKSYLRTLKLGDSVSVMGPLGEFTLPEDAGEQIVLLGGGIGITPFRSLIAYATDRQLPLKITLIYSNQTPEDIVYMQDWKHLQAENPNLTIVHTITKPEEAREEWKGHTGRIDAMLLREYVPDPSKAEYFVCGPPNLVSALTNVLTEIGADPKRIRVENFRGYTD